VVATMGNRSFEQFIGWRPGADGSQGQPACRDRPHPHAHTGCRRPPGWLAKL